MPLPLLALAISAFSIGMTEFVVIGILPILASAFHISIGDAGNLVTWYALSVVVGAPLGAAFTAYMPRKTLMISLMVLFAIGNLLSALAFGYGQLVLGRILSGIAHGVFFAVSTNVAVQIVPKEKQASAIALMFSGLTVALVAGVPLGTFLATSLSWRITFFVVTACGLISLLALFFFLPSHIHHVKPKTIFRQFSVFLNKKILVTYFMTILSFGAPFIAYTFLAAILQHVTGFSKFWIGPLLIIYGVAVVLGNIYGGKQTDRRGPLPTLKIFSASLIIILIAFYFGQYDKFFAVPLIFLWGIAAFALVPALQFLIVAIVKHCNLEAADLASGANIAAFNIGISGGSYLGSIIVDHWALAATPLISALGAAVAFLFICLMQRHFSKI